MNLKVYYKVASTNEEFEQIHNLNYETFVEEIPQYKRRIDKKLVDRFHDENTYIVAKMDEEVVGMVAVRANRPFSLDQKLSNLDQYIGDDNLPCELRLLSVKKNHRKGIVFFGLMDRLVAYCLEQKYDLALISGTDREFLLYRKLGFKPFAGMVGTKEANFLPMKLSKQRFMMATQAFHRILARYDPVSFLSGPVPVSEKVEQALTQPPVSHRSVKFHEKMKRVQQLICNKTNAQYTSVLSGTGTLANDVVAQQIKSIKSTGLILANGEFGERLIDHAKRANLSFYSLKKDWNSPVDLSDIHELLVKYPEIKWIWTVHCETSTGYLYNLEELKEIAAVFNLHLCVDACSSLGVDNVDLSNVYLASSVSGKGLGSFPGLAIVCHSYQPLPNQSIPRYLDLGMYASSNSTPFTHSSNWLDALEAALQEGTAQKEELMRELRHLLSSQGWNLLGDRHYSNGIVTISIPFGESSKKIGNLLIRQGIMVNFESNYLNNKNWIQIAIMGKVTKTDITRLNVAFHQLNKKRIHA